MTSVLHHCISKPRMRASTLHACRSSEPSAMPVATTLLKSPSMTTDVSVHAVESATGRSTPSAVMELQTYSRSAASCSEPYRTVI
jgi:hypothetical protein